MKIYALLYLVLSLINASQALSNAEPAEEPKEEPEAEGEQDVIDTSNLENEKDDYDIYSFGLIGQEHPELIPTVMLPMSKFPHVMKVAQLWSRLYNEKHKLIPESEYDANDLVMRSKKGIQRYQTTRALITVMATKSQEIKKEISEIVNKRDQVTMSIEDLLEFFDLHDYYASIVSKMNSRDPTIGEMEKQLELIIYEFLSNMRGFLDGLDNARHIDRVIVSQIKPFGKKMVDHEDFTLQQRVEAGFSMIDTIMAVKNEINGLARELKAGAVLTHNFREQVFEIILGLNSMDSNYSAAALEAFNKKYCGAKSALRTGLTLLVYVVLSSVF